MLFFRFRWIVSSEGSHFVTSPPPESMVSSHHNLALLDLVSEKEVWSVL